MKQKDTFWWQRIFGSESPKRQQRAGRVSNHAEAPTEMLRSLLASASSSFWSSVRNELDDLKVPSDYYTQVQKSRELWPVYGSNTGKYPDPVVTAVMDLMVAVATSFGSENLFKDIPPDHPAKKVLDHWCATVNSSNPMLTPGLDAVRRQFHRGRWCDGGGVVGGHAKVPRTTAHRMHASVARFEHDGAGIEAQ